jgi:hypothetical protein
MLFGTFVCGLVSPPDELYRALVDEMCAWCSQVYRVLIAVDAVDLPSAYIAAFGAYVKSTRKLTFIFSGLTEHWCPSARVCAHSWSGGGRQLAILVWRDVVLRQCIGPLVRACSAADKIDRGKNLDLDLQSVSDMMRSEGCTNRIAVLLNMGNIIVSGRLILSRSSTSFCHAKPLEPSM